MILSINPWPQFCENEVDNDMPKRGKYNVMLKMCQFPHCLVESLEMDQFGEAILVRKLSEKVSPHLEQIVSSEKSIEVSSKPWVQSLVSNPSRLQIETKQSPIIK